MTILGLQDILYDLNEFGKVKGDELVRVVMGNRKDASIQNIEYKRVMFDENGELSSGELVINLYQSDCECD